MVSRKRPAQPEPASQSSELEPLLTMVDVQRILRLSKPKVYELMLTHGLPSLKIDGARRFDPAKLRSWIEQQNDHS